MDDEQPWLKYQSAGLESESGTPPWLKYQSAPTQTESLGRGIAQGGTLGFSDELAGVGGMIADRLARAMTPSVGSPNPETDAKMRALEESETPSSLDVYRKGRDEERGLNQKAMEAFPKTYLGGEIGSSVFLPGTAIKNAKGAAQLGAVQGLGLGESDLTEGDLTGSAIDTAFGGAAGLAGYGAGKAIGAGYDYAKPRAKLVTNAILKKMGKITSNIPEEFTDRYLRTHGNINPRPSAEIADDIAGKFSEKSQNVAESIDLEKAAKERLARAREGVSTGERKIGEELADERFLTGNQLGEARGRFSDAARLTEETLRKKETGLQPQDLFDAINDLKTNVKVGSSEAYEILGNLEGSVRVNNARRAVEQGIESLKVKGQPVSDTAVSSIKSLEALKDRLMALGDDISYPEAKAIIQQLDSDIDYAMSQGGFSSPADLVKKKIRSVLDQTLKNNSPEYRAAMEKVAEETRLLSQVSDAFGQEGKAISRLNQLGSPRGKAVDAPLIKQLGEKTGRDFSTGIDDVLGAKAVTGSPTALKVAKESVPEFQSVLALEKKAQELGDPSYKRGLLERFKKTNAYQELALAEKEALEAAAARTQAKAAFEPVKPFKAGVQSKMKDLTGARKDEADKLFKGLEKATKSNYRREIKDRAILDAFEKTDTQGSRKTLMGKAAGGLLGGAIGLGTGEDSKSAATGAAIGFALDKYSGRVFKALLDGKIGAAEARAALGNTFGKYTPAMIKSALQGPKAFGVTASILSKDSEFKKKLQNAKDSEKQK